MIIDAEIVAGTVVEEVEEVIYVDQRLVITGLQGETKAWNGMTYVERHKHCTWSVLCPTDQDAIVGGHVLAMRIHGHGLTSAQQVNFYPMGARCQHL